MDDSKEKEGCFDPDAYGETIEGLSVSQIRKLKAYYQKMTDDLDLENIDRYVRV